MTTTRNAEFQNLKLAQIYESFNQFSEDENFWLSIINGLTISNITDFWCWTWLLTHRLMELWYTVRWIEPASAMLEQARNKEWSEKIEYIEWDYKKLEKSSTELILMTSHVAQFISENEWEDFLRKAFDALKEWWYILFDTKNPIPKPWGNYTREKYNKTKDTPFWRVNIQIETTNISWNEVEHTIYYTFEDTWEKLESKNNLVYRKKNELEKSLIKAWFKVIKVYGLWDSREYNDDCEEIIFLAKK